MFLDMSEVRKFTNDASIVKIIEAIKNYLQGG